jgi:hypothetical protein
MKKTIFKFILIFVFIYSLFLGIWVTNAATIYSTTTWGSWTSNWTWVWWVVPWQYDDAIIKWQVIVENQTVNNINIQSWASLTNYFAWWSTSYSALLDIKWNLVNNGSIFTSNDQSWYNDYLNLKVNWNIENNWTITNNS